MGIVVAPVHQKRSHAVSLFRCGALVEKRETKQLSELRQAPQERITAQHVVSKFVEWGPAVPAVRVGVIPDDVAGLVPGFEESHRLDLLDVPADGEYRR